MPIKETLQKYMMEWNYMQNDNRKHMSAKYESIQLDPTFSQHFLFAICSLILLCVKADSKGLWRGNGVWKKKINLKKVY